MIGAIIGAAAYTVIVAHVVVRTIICAMADTMRPASVVVGTIIGTVADTMGTTVIAATPRIAMATVTAMASIAPVT
ncbi:hypothetical protein M6G63_16080 [Pseudomonas sp. BYT-5]|uniref:hypothetical protein n=1 Tax=Pseudomonas sp. BYT-5 TaxID=2944392 RepID=UPI0003A95736|nr:hypothetical protein [Pseudomonas sp. BYT-5]URD45210.1 hypothetical protein M6G63_16080 [Pseudomonas sp. BYT-5]